MQHTNLKFKMQSTMYDSVQHVENFNLCTNVREYILGLDWEPILVPQYTIYIQGNA